MAEPIVDIQFWVLVRTLSNIKRESKCLTLNIKIAKFDKLGQQRMKINWSVFLLFAFSEVVFSFLFTIKSFWTLTFTFSKLLDVFCFCFMFDLWLVQALIGRLCRQNGFRLFDRLLPLQSHVFKRKKRWREQATTLAFLATQKKFIAIFANDDFKKIRLLSKSTLNIVAYCAKEFACVTQCKAKRVASNK